MIILHLLNLGNKFNWDVVIGVFTSFPSFVRGYIMKLRLHESFKKYISYRPILVSSSAMTLIMYILRSYQFTY
jgi:hypothetical protein